MFVGAICLDFTNLKIRNQIFGLINLWLREEPVFFNHQRVFKGQVGLVTMSFTQTALEAQLDTLIDGCLGTMYRYPTCRVRPLHAAPTSRLEWFLIFPLLFFQEMYQTTQPFYPEGVHGTINSIVMGFLGMQVRWNTVCPPYEGTLLPIKWNSL